MKGDDSSAKFRYVRKGEKRVKTSPKNETKETESSEKITKPKFLSK
jgi:hypothetical protein